MDHDCGGESGLKIPAELIDHLSKEDRAEFLKIVTKISGRLGEIKI